MGWILIDKKRRFLQEPHGVTPQNTPFFIVTAVKTSNLTLPSFVDLGTSRRCVVGFTLQPL
jgi:hypothetical protein